MSLTMTVCSTTLTYSVLLFLHVVTGREKSSFGTNLIFSRRSSPSRPGVRWNVRGREPNTSPAFNTYSPSTGSQSSGWISVPSATVSILKSLSLSETAPMIFILMSRVESVLSVMMNGSMVLSLYMVSAFAALDSTRTAKYIPGTPEYVSRPVLQAAIQHSGSASHNNFAFDVFIP